MGSRIAAHFANAGVACVLLDLATPEKLNAKAIGLYSESLRRLITPGNFDQHLNLLRDCDWIVEAVSEELEIKRALWRRVEAVRRPTALVSTNTSGIALAKIAQDFSIEFRRHFLGTHFFNPPRYLHLVEIIPGPDTNPEVLRYLSDFCDRRLGKGVVPAKDTPNFIANRIGNFFMATVWKIVREGGYTIEEADALTGPLIGLPSTASFRLLDVVGLDIWARVAKNVQDAAPEDPWRDRFALPGYFSGMLERGWLGDKTGQGFYQRVNKDIKVINCNTLEYHPPESVSFPSLEAARGIESLPQRLRALVESSDRAGTFVWKLLSDLLLYSAEHVPEISDRTVEIDRAMRWGYAHKLGPFEIWDALGFESTAWRLERENRPLPAGVKAMLDSGAKSFYRTADADRQPRTEYFDLARCEFKPIEERPGILVLADLKRSRGVVRKNAGASLIDLGDGVLCVEFHSPRNTLGEDQVSMIHAGIEETARHYQALIIANQGDNFSTGVDLTRILQAAQNGLWDQLDDALQRFQAVNLAIKYAPKPVLAAPFGRTLGGGCEVALHAARRQASAELSAGLTEAAAGLLPAAGGCKELLLRLGQASRVFELITQGQVSTSALQARELGLLAEVDGVSMNPERLIADAKTLALATAPGYVPGLEPAQVRVGGEGVFAQLKLAAWLKREAHLISDYDLVIAVKLAHILSGGAGSGEQIVSEQVLLDLEREAFLSLCGNHQTQERLEHLLKTGKPLRN